MEDPQEEIYPAKVPPVYSRDQLKVSACDVPVRTARFGEQ
jgi:hypothetical protein